MTESDSPSPKPTIISNINAKSILFGLSKNLQCQIKSTSTAAWVPNIAPDAPIDASPVSEKLPPRIKPKTPEMLYSIKNLYYFNSQFTCSYCSVNEESNTHLSVPICFSTRAELVSNTKPFKRRCTIPTCNQRAVKNLKVWFGVAVPLPNPPNPQISSSVQVCVIVDDEEEESLRHLKGVCVISGILRMQAVKRAPRLMSISDEGPII